MWPYRSDAACPVSLLLGTGGHAGECYPPGHARRGRLLGGEPPGSARQEVESEGKILLGRACGRDTALSGVRGPLSREPGTRGKAWDRGFRRGVRPPVLYGDDPRSHALL